MGTLKTMATLMRNARAAGFSNPMEAMAAAAPADGKLAPTDVQGRSELTGKTFAYETPDGLVRVSINGEEMQSSVADDEPTISPTYATRVADGIYFVSWAGEPSGNHVVFDANTMKVYDQILPDGTREEAIYLATCFAVDGC